MFRSVSAVLLAVWFFFSCISIAQAQTVEASSNAQCPAPHVENQTSYQYLGAGAAPININVLCSNSTCIKETINLSRQACSQPCPTGNGKNGTIPGVCTLQAGKPVCQATSACNNQPIDKAGPASPNISPTATTPNTGNQTQGGTGSTQVGSTAANTLNSANQPSGNQAAGNNSTGGTTPQSQSPTVGSSGAQQPQTFTSPSPLAAPQTSSGLSGQIQPNASIFSQALNALSAGSGAQPGTSLNTITVSGVSSMPYSQSTLDSNTTNTTQPPNESNNPQGTQNTSPCTTLCNVQQAAQNSFQWAENNLNFASPAAAADVTTLKTVAEAQLRKAEAGLTAAEGLWSYPNQEQKAILDAGRNAAAGLVGTLRDLGNNALSNQVAAYVRKIDSLKNPANQTRANFQASNAIGDALIQNVRGFLSTLPSVSSNPQPGRAGAPTTPTPQASFGQIGRPAPSPNSSITGEPTGGVPSPQQLPAANPAPAQLPPGNINNINDRTAVAQQAYQMVMSQGIHPNELVPGNPNYGKAWNTVVQAVRQSLASRGMLNPELDTAFIAAVARQETDIPGNPNEFQSSTGVRGVMQVTGGDAHAVLGYGSLNTWTGPLNTATFAREDNIGSIITAGIELNSLLFKDGGNLATAAQIYNSGSPTSCVGGGCVNGRPTYGPHVAQDTAVMRNAQATCNGNASCIESQLGNLSQGRSRGTAALSAFASILSGSNAPIVCAYQGCSATPSIQPGNPGYAPGINRVSSCPSSGLCYFDPQTGAYGVSSNPDMSQQQFQQAAREDDAIERLVQAGTITAQQAATYSFQNFKATLSTLIGTAANANTPEGAARLAGELAAGTGISNDQAQQLVGSNPTGVINAINAISSGSGVSGALQSLGLPTTTQVNQQAVQQAIAQNGGVSLTAAQTQSTYTIANQNGDVVAQNVPLPPGAVALDGTVRLLADQNGLPLGQGVTPLQNSQSPLQISSDSTLPQPTPDQTNPQQSDFTDNRPTAPRPSPTSAAPSTYVPPSTIQNGNQTYCLTNTEPLVWTQCSGSQPGQQRYLPPLQQQPQAAPQPLPAPQLVSQFPTSQSSSTASTTLPVAIVSIIANPTSVQNGATSFISWSSVGTIGCMVVMPNGTQIGSSTQSGSVTSPALSTTTTFTAECTSAPSTVQAGSTVSASTTVTLQ